MSPVAAGRGWCAAGQLVRGGLSRHLVCVAGPQAERGDRYAPSPPSIHSYWIQSVELIIAAEERISRRRGLIDSDYCRAPMRRLDAEEDAMIERFLGESERQLSPIEMGEMRA